MNDADREMAVLQELGRRATALHKRGICDHGWLHAPETGPAKCLHCGKVFPSSQAAYDEHRELLS